MKKPVILAINAESAAQKVADGWDYARQRDFTGGESLAELPEMIARNQLAKMENCVISPEGLITECWQMDVPLFINVTGGIVVTPIPGTSLFTVYSAVDAGIMCFTFDPASPTPYDMADASGYPGYTLHEHESPVTIFGISHGTPFLGKNYCCAATDLYSLGSLTADPEAIDFGTLQTLDVSQIPLTITNATEEVMTLTGIILSGNESAMFGHTATFPQTLDPDDTYTFDVAYKPSVPGDSAATLNLSSTLGILQIALSGTAESMVSETPASWDFGIVNQGDTAQHTFQLTNSGGRAVSVIGFNVSGDDASRFTSNLALPAVIAAGATLDIVVTFTPGSALHACSANAGVVTDVGSIDGIALSGTGVLWDSTPPSATLTAIGIGKPVYAHFSITNKSESSPLTVTSVTAVGPALYMTPAPALPITLAPGEALALVVAFSLPFSSFPPQTGNLRVVSDWGTLLIPLSYAGHA